MVMEGRKRGKKKREGEDEKGQMASSSSQPSGSGHTPTESKHLPLLPRSTREPPTRRQQAPLTGSPLDLETRTFLFRIFSNHCFLSHQFHPTPRELFLLLLPFFLRTFAGRVQHLSLRTFFAFAIFTYGFHRCQAVFSHPPTHLAPFKKNKKPTDESIGCRRCLVDDVTNIYIYIQIYVSIHAFR